MTAVKDNRRPMPPKRKIDTTKYSGRIAARLRALREERGWTVATLAEEINRHLPEGQEAAPSTAHSWENGSRKIDPDLYPVLARVFRMKLYEFLPAK